MNFELTEEQKLLQKTVKDFTLREIGPIAQQIDRENRLPDDLIKKMAALKILGMNLPAEYGGNEAGSIDCILVIEQLSYSGTGAWWLPAFSSSIPESILIFGTEQQKKKYLPPVTDGDIYPSLQFTEPDTGSDPSALLTRAKRDGDHFIINGEKRFSTFGARNGFAVLYARDENGESTAFIVDKNIKGYSTGSIYDLMGGGGIEAADVHFDNYRISKDNLLGTQGSGMDILLNWISNEKIQQCGACLGIADAALDEAVSYAKNRILKKGTLSDLQGIRWMLAEMHSKVNAARWVTYRAAFLKDKGIKTWTTEAATAKTFVVPAAMEVVEMSRRIHGSYGYTKEFKIERLYRAIAGASAIAVSLEINKSIIGASLL